MISEVKQMSETAVAPETSVVKVCILTGPRQGQITHVDLERQEVLTDEETELLLAGLRDLNAAFEGLKRETQGLKEDIRSLKGI